MDKCKANGRIALFVPNLGGGGAERVILNLACGFVEHGYPVDLILSSAEGEYLDELDSRVRLVDLRARRVATSLLALINYLRTERPSVMLSTQGHANLIALIAGSFPGVDTRIIVRDTESPVGASARQQTLWTRFIGLLARFWYSKAYSIVAVCGDIKQQIARERSVPLDKISVIYNPVRVENISQRAREPAGHEWLDSPTAPVLLSVGRLDKQKDFASLIRAFEIIRRDIDAKLLILGEGPLRGELTNLVECLGVNDDVDLPGFVTNPYAYLSRADIFVLSSLWEGLPNVMLEALALGTPIVATDCETGPREILRGGKDGILVPVEDPAALAEGIRRSLMTNERPPIASKSLQRFEFSCVIDQYLDLMYSNNVQQ